MPDFELAYRAGNYALARRLARAALDGPQGARAREILERIKVDPVALLVFAAAFVLVAVVALLGLG